MTNLKKKQGNKKKTAARSRQRKLNGRAPKVKTKKPAAADHDIARVVELAMGNVVAPVAPVAPLPELAFYYPGPMWENGNLIKRLLLFFDGVSLLVPNYLVDKPGRIDPAIVVALKDENLLHVLEPENFVDAQATTELDGVITELLEGGVLDALTRADVEFHAISYSRLGWFGDEKLARGIFRRLEMRGLARASEDGVSIPMHPVVRGLILVALAQILRPQGIRRGMDLIPVTDRPQLVDGLDQLLHAVGHSQKVSVGDVVRFDFDEVGVDLGAVPIDEVLAFRRENLKEHVAYRRAVTRSVRELSALPPEQRASEFEVRSDMLHQQAADLHQRAKKAWKRKAAVGLGIAGAVASLATGHLSGLMGLFSAFLRGEGGVDRGAYSFLFRAAERFPTK